jgi:hypothetical protein
MKASKRVGLVLGIITFLSLGFLHTALFAVDNPATRSSLEGLKGVYLEVPPLPAGAERLGLSGRGIYQDMRRKLERAGVPLLSDSEYSRLRQSERYPLTRLEILVTAYDIEELELVIYYIVVQTRQAMFLARKPVVKLMATTWSREEVGHGVDASIVRDKISSLVDDFIDAYFSVNTP